MAIFMLTFFGLLIVFSIVMAQGNKLAVRFPTLKKPLAVVSTLGDWLFMAGIICGLVWFSTRPSDPPSPPKTLPATIHPPSLEGTHWKIFYLSSEDRKQFSMDLASRQTKKDEAIVWWRYDDLSKQETTLTLTRYDCEFGHSTDINSVYYEHGVYTGYDEADVEEASTKVDLETIWGSGFLLACFNKDPVY